MKSKRKKNKVKKNDGHLYQLLLSPSFLRTVLIIITGACITLTSIYIYKQTVKRLTINKVTVIGNKHLSDREIRTLMKIKKRENILNVDIADMRNRLLQSPWIEEAMIRKELSHTLIVRITEAEPLALLRRSKTLYIVNREGVILEKLSQTIPFLPVIEVQSNKKDTLKGALQLVATIRAENLFSDKEIEILARSPQNMTLKIDNLLIKVGTGNYRAKLLRLVQLEEEISRRGIPVEYIDLRFSKRVIVRPKKRFLGE